MVYKPHKYQQKFHKSKARFRSIFAGRRSGKTVCGVIEALIKSLEFENCNGTDYRGIIVEPTYGDITRFLIPEIEKWWGPYIASFNRSNNKVTLKNGFVVYLLSSTEFDRFRGNKLRWLWLDEAEYYPYGQKLWEAAFPCLTDYKGICWMSTTTRGKGWGFQTFRVPAIDGNEMYESFVFKTTDNPVIPVEEIEIARQTLPEKQFKIEYEASFEDFVGQIYYTFSLRDHVVDDFSVPPHWRIIKGIDIGYRHPFAAIWVAIDQHDRYFVFKEYRESNKTVRENGQELVRIDTKPEELYMVDPSAYAIDHVSGQQKVKDLKELGLFMKPANNSVLQGIDRVTQLINEGRLFVFRSCEKTIEEFTQYRWEDEQTVKGEPKPYKLGDDLMDALRYACMQFWDEKAYHSEPVVIDILEELAKNRPQEIAKRALDLNFSEEEYQPTDITFE